MAGIFSGSGNADTTSVHDPILPWLRSLKKLLEGPSSRDACAPDLCKLLSDCIAKFKGMDQYRNDIRFLKIWLLYLGLTENFESVLGEMFDIEIGARHSLLYVSCAAFLESKGKLYDAQMVYQLGMRRKAEPFELLKKAESLFLIRMSEIVKACLTQKINGDEPNKPSCGDEPNKTNYGDESKMPNCGDEPHKPEDGYISPWSSSTMKDLLRKINPQILKFEGYSPSAKAYSGKVTLASLKNSAKDKMLEMGRRKYQIKGCAGQGGFAQVYKAYVNGNPDDVVALKIQKPAFPWEFYMYRLLDLRISEKERLSFGFAHSMHHFSDSSILVCDYLAHGTLQDVVNSYVVIGKSMEEVLCIYYTIEMLYMLETLHGVGILHGDFKPDNLLIRYSRDNLTEDGFLDHSGPWRYQGLCLVDWGRGIDLRLFPDNVQFRGDCRTSSFRCTEMQEDRPWKFQVDLYNFCVVVHLMLHGSYLETKKKPLSDGSYIYQPKTSFKRYWKIGLWDNLFSKLLNISTCDYDKNILKSIRESFQEHMCSSPQLIRKLKELLVKQRISLCSA